MGHRDLSTLLAAGAALSLLACARGALVSDERAEFPLAAGEWRADRAWYDGRAEVARYDATRDIYGVRREYVATAYTNVQRMDPTLAVKAEGDRGVEVLKHHWSERAPTENYDYDFSTAVFLRKDDLAPFKLAAATQEDCGASFKQVWREGGELRWLESVYFPGTGLRQGKLPADGVQLEDALPLLLREHVAAPFEPFEVRLLPSQKTTRRAPFEPFVARVEDAGDEVLDLPAGRVPARHLRVIRVEDGTPVTDFWFALEGAAPWLHALVQLEAPGGVSYRLRSVERDAYWERP